MKLLKAAALSFGVLSSTGACAQETVTSTGGDPYPARAPVIVEEDPAAPLTEQCLEKETATDCVLRGHKVAENENKLVVVFFKAQEQNQIVPIVIRPDGEFRILEAKPAVPDSPQPKSF